MHKRRRRGPWVGITAFGLIRCQRQIVDLGERLQVAEFLRADHCCIHAHALQHLDILAESIGIVRSHRENKSCPREAALAPHHIIPVLEVAQGGKGHARLGLIGVMHAHQRP